MKNALSVAAFLAMVAGLLGLLALKSLFSPLAPVIVVQALAVGLMVWARVTFGRRSFHPAASPTAGGLVTSGPYRVIRHPIYTSVCLFVGAAVVAHWSWVTLGLGVLVLAGALARIFAEEALLRARYSEYAEYSARTWRMVPGVF